MTSFDSLSQVKEFLNVDGKRGAILVELSKLKDQLGSLSQENPVVRPFERIEARVDEGLDRLRTASEAVSSFLIKAGGNPLTDSGFKQYCQTENDIIQEIETLRDEYHSLLVTKGML